MSQIEQTAGLRLGRTLRFALLASSVGIGAFMTGTAAYAQEAQDAAAEEEVAEPAAIVITGSRIQRRDYQANSPIVTAGAELLNNSSTTAIETNLNKLPQFSPAQTPALGGDIQPTATNTPGAATISLRGIGANRSLVLLDGRRATPANASMAVDINTIPSAAIERVEIISGGASSTYGADAVAGVTNFILKKNFQGLQLDSQIGLTERGDGREYQVSGIMGTDFEDGRGNISIAFSTNDRKSSYRIDRPWFQSLYRNPTITGTEFFSPYAYLTPGANTAPPEVLNAIFAGRPGTANFPDTANIFFNDDGTAFSGFLSNGGSTAGAYRFKGDLTGLRYKTLSNGGLSSNFLQDYLNFPSNRWNFFTRGNYEINDWVSVFAQGYFNKTSTSTVQQPAPSANGWSTMIDYNSAAPNRQLPAELVQILNARRTRLTAAVGTPGTPGYVPATYGAVGSAANTPFQLNTYLDFIGNRVNTSDVFTYSMMAGLQGKIPGTDWTWEVYGSQGESETSALQTGFASLQRYRTILNAPNWGQGFRATGNAQQGGFGGSTATCTSGLNPFDPNLVVSADCIEAIRADIKTRSVMSQTVWEGTAQGKLLTLPAGDLRTAVGATYRQNRFVFQNDTLTTQGQSFIDQSVGLYPSGNSKGSITVKEIYGELLVPVLKDLPAIRELSLELGIRHSDYNTTGSVTTWKALGDWAVTDWIRIRGGFNKAVRAPNIAELFLAPQQTFASAAGGDLCSLNNPMAYSAGTGNTTNRAAVEALCRTIMNREDPTGTTADNFYSIANNQGAGAVFVFPTLQGNPNIKPETAETWTVGAVVSSPFESPWLNRLRLTVDYYNIKVTDAIGAQSADVIQRRCFDVALNPGLNPNSAACLAVNRNVGVGTVGNLLGTYLNNGAFQTSGVDAQLDWAVDVGPGRFSLNSVFNYLIEMKSTELAGVVAPIDFAGTLGGNGINGLNGGFYRWKLFNTFGYNVGPVNVALQWQHLPSIKSQQAAVNAATTLRGAPAYDIFNLNGSVKVTKDASIRFGVDNLFDKAPPLVEVNSAPPAGTVAGGAVGGSAAGNLMYDILGRRYYIGATFKF